MLRLTIPRLAIDLGCFDSDLSILSGLPNLSDLPNLSNLSNLNHQIFPERHLLTLTQVAERICNDSTCPRFSIPSALNDVIIRALKVAVHPDAGKW